MSGAGGGNGTGTATAGPAGPKPAAGRRFRLTDSTLRDGSHAVAHRFTPEQVSAVVAGLDAAGVPMIEVTHGDGLGGSSFQYGFSGTDERELIAAAVAAAKRARIAVLLLPGIGVAEDLRVAKDLGASLARIATHCTEADISAEHLETAKHLGLETVGFLMMAHMTPPADLARQARLMESYGADCVYVVDSAGHMTPDDVRDRVRALKDALQPGTQVGIHAHNNLSLAIANSLAALEEGVEQVDACTRGLGAGAGNTQTEVMVAVAERLGYETGIDPLAMMDVAEDVVAPIMARPQLIDRATLSLGYAGVYSSFLLHAERAAARFGVDARSILLELGRRRIVGGQEDMIVDVAMELAARRA